MKIAVSHFLLGIVLAHFAGITEVSAQEKQSVLVAGMTYTVKNKDEYKRAPSIRIQVYNSLGAIGDAVQSTDKAEFELAVAPGEPVKLLFRGEQDDEKLIPQVKQLAAIANSSNQINVALYTPTEYQKAHGRIALKKELQCLLHKLPTDATEARATVNEMMTSYFKEEE